MEKSEKVIDCWSKSRFEVQNCVTVKHSADFSAKTLRLSTTLRLRIWSAQKSKQNNRTVVQFDMLGVFSDHFY